MIISSYLFLFKMYRINEVYQLLCFKILQCYKYNPKMKFHHFLQKQNIWTFGYENKANCCSFVNFILKTVNCQKSPHKKSEISNSALTKANCKSSSVGPHAHYQCILDIFFDYIFENYSWSSFPIVFIVEKCLATLQKFLFTDCRSLFNSSKEQSLPIKRRIFSVLNNTQN